MPKDQASDLITDQEIDFARLVLSRTMNDREAAQAVGLDPDTAAYVKSKPGVCAFMLGHRAALQQQLADHLVAQETEEQRRRNLRREQVLDRLLEVATMSPERTRGSINGQVKALSLLVAIDGLIPDRPAGSSTAPKRASSSQETQSTSRPDKPQMDAAARLAEQQQKAVNPEPSPAVAQEEEEPGLAQPEPAAASAADAPPLSGLTPATTSDPSKSAATPSSVPDTRVLSSIRRRWGR